MPKNSIADWSQTAVSNSDVGGINIAEGCPPGNMNDMGREIMKQLADFYQNSGQKFVSNIGINVTPDTLIHAKGTGGTGTGSPSLTLENSTATTGRKYLVNVNDTGVFRVLDVTGSNAVRLSISSLGNVGVGGNASSVTKFAVNATQNLYGGGDQTIPALATTVVTGELTGNSSGSVNSDYGFLRLSAGGGASLTYKAAIDIQGYGLTDNSQIRFYTAGAERMRLDASGNLGIGGAAAVDYKVDVTGIIKNNNDIITTGGRVALYRAAGASYIDWASTQSLTFRTTTSAGGAGPTTAMSLSADRTLSLSNADNSQQGTLQMGASGLTIAATGANFIAVNTNATERVRFDSAGYAQFSSNHIMPYQGAPTSKSAAATLTGAELVTGIIQYTGSNATLTLPTAANIEAMLTWSAVNVCFEFSIIVTGAGTCTLGANGNTAVGSLVVSNGTSGRFRIRRTAATPTFTIYRIS